MTLTGPKRAFSVGETKSQNAVIKIYTVDQFKNALTKIYQLPSGTGTIEVASDITITEPIKLKRFIFGEGGPREIIIQGIAGAKIINGNTSENQGYNWNQSGNTGIPVFDYGIVNVTTNPITKYTFKDLVINTEDAVPFGALLAGDLGGQTSVSRKVALVSLLNIKMFNVWNVLGAYDSAGTFNTSTYYTYLNPKIIDLLYRNNSRFAITTTYLNSRNAGLAYGNITGIGVWNDGQFFQTEDDFTITNNVQLNYNSFNNIYARVNIEVPDRTNVGIGNVITGTAEILSTHPEAGFTYLNTLNTIGGSSTFIDADSVNRSFGYGLGRVVNAPGGGTIIAPTANFSFVGYSNGNAALISVDLPDTSTYCHYQVDWYLTIKEVNTELVNSYHIKTTLTISNAGTGSILDNSTIHAHEGTTGISGLIPSWNNAAKRLSIAPTAGAGVNLNCVASINVSGLKYPLIATI